MEQIYVKTTLLSDLTTTESYDAGRAFTRAQKIWFNCDSSSHARDTITQRGVIKVDLNPRWSSNVHLISNWYVYIVVSSWSEPYTRPSLHVVGGKLLFPSTEYDTVLRSCAEWFSSLLFLLNCKSYFQNDLIDCSNYNSNGVFLVSICV